MLHNRTLELLAVSNALEELEAIARDGLLPEDRELSARVAIAGLRSAFCWPSKPERAANTNTAPDMNVSTAFDDFYFLRRNYHHPARANGGSAVKEIAQFVAERNAALLTGDIETVRALQRKWNPGAAVPSNSEIELAGMHKAITAVPALPVEHRRKSKQWLTERGYQSHDDGDL